MEYCTWKNSKVLINLKNDELNMYYMYKKNRKFLDRNLTNTKV